MITWLQTTFQKHNKVLFGSLLAVIIVAFVLTIGNQSFLDGGASSGGPTVTRRDFFGVNLAGPRAYEEVIQRAQVSSLTNPDIPVRPQQISAYAFMRLAALNVANELGIPHPTDEQVQEHIRSRTFFTNPDGSFNNDMYVRFMDTVRSDPTISEVSVAEALKEDWRIFTVFRAAGGPGYVLPFEAEQKYIEDNTVWTVIEASMNFTTFQPEIIPSEEELKAFFDRDPTRYTIPERVSSTLVRFPEEAFRAEISPTEADLRNYFTPRQQRFQKPPPTTPEGEEPVEMPMTTFEEVREEVRQAYIEDTARLLAAQAADSYAEGLWRNKVPREAANERAAEVGGLPETVAPYDRESLPWETGLTREALISIFDLGAGRYFSDAVQTSYGGAVLLLDEILPSYVPDLAEVRETVLADYILEMREEQFFANGQEMRERLAAGVAAGGDFTTLAEEEGLLVASFSEFTLMDPPEGLTFEVFRDVIRLDEGDLSAFTRVGPNGIIAFAAQKQLPEVPEGSEELDRIREGMAQMTATANILAFFGEMSAREEARLEAENPEFTNTDG